jgi:hypothetical protein
MVPVIIRANAYSLSMGYKDSYRLLSQRIQGMEQARKLQAKEYKRRLKILNGEAERLRGIQATYVPREVYGKDMQDLLDKIQILTDYKNGQQGKSQLLQYIPWLLTGVSILFMLLTYYKK